ncbi:MAG: DUF4012 domain-containing protein, partial [bacterium]|nr:DUF4012 domain-containing protein [bacterium]
MKKKIKIYTHHNQYEQVDYQKPFRLFEILWSVLSAIFSMLFEILYLLGLAVIQIASSPLSIVRVVKTFPQKINALVNHYQLREFRRTLSIFAVLLIVTAALVQGAVLIASGQSLKGKVLGSSDEALHYLRDAQTALDAQDVTQAQGKFTQALEQFEKTEQELKSSGAILKGLLAVVPQKQDADKLLEAAQLLTDSAVDATQTYDTVQNIKVGPEGISGVDNSKETLENLRFVINKSTTKVLKASDLLNDVSVTIIPESQRTAFLQVRDTLTQLEGSMVALRETFDILTTIALGNKNVLLVFQNNNELRATGGFIGTIGKASISDGQIKALDIRSVYDFDGQMQEWILPPKPMYAVNDRWYLRDANWFADFKESSERIIT